MIPAIVAEEDRVLGIDDEYPLAGGNHRERRKPAGKWMQDDGALSLIEQAELTDRWPLGLCEGGGHT